MRASGLARLGKRRLSLPLTHLGHNAKELGVLKNPLLVLF